MPPRLLLIEPDFETADALVSLLRAEGFEVGAVHGLDEAFHAIDREPYHLVVADLIGASLEERMTMLERLVEQASPVPVGVFSAWPFPAALEPVAGVAFAATRPLGWEELLSRIAAALEVPLSDEDQARAQVVRRYFAALDAHDFDALADTCAEDVVYVVPGPGAYAAAVEGRDAFRTFSEKTFRTFTDARFSVLRIDALPHGLAARYHGSWTGPDGRPQAMGGAVVFGFRDRRISSIGVRLDQERLARLMRVPPDAG